MFVWDFFVIFLFNIKNITMDTVTVNKKSIIDALEKNKKNHIKAYEKAFAEMSKGQLVDAYDKSPRFKGKKIATIRLTKAPYKQALKDMPEDHFEREGGLMLWPRGLVEFQAMMGPMDKVYWVVEFEIEEATNDNR